MGKKKSKREKKAWRNISTTDIDGFNEKTTRDAHSGGSLASAPSDSIFVLDKSSSSARMIMDPKTGRNKGFGFVTFETEAESHKAIKALNNRGTASQPMTEEVLGTATWTFLHTLAIPVFLCCPILSFSSKPTGSAGGTSYGQDGQRSSHGSQRSSTLLSDWMCAICGCVNFARRVSCFQCNESRTDDVPSANLSSSSSAPLGRKGAEAGLIVAG